MKKFITSRQTEKFSTYILNPKANIKIIIKTDKPNEQIK